MTSRGRFRKQSAKMETYQMPIGFSKLGYNFILIFILISITTWGQTGCTSLNTPLHQSTDISLNTQLQWMLAPNAVGYRLTVGTTSGGNDILNLVDVGNVTDYQFVTPLSGLTTYYVTITPRTNTGNITNCPEESFTTRAEGVPGCTEIINPFDNDDLVSTTANITWIRDFSATGYLMTIYERDPNGILILDRVDVGNGTNFKPPDFKPRTRYYVTIFPYNTFGSAADCSSISFTTGDGPPLPDCTELIFPGNQATGIQTNPTLNWNTVPNADGYFITLGTTPRGSDILDAEDVGNNTSFATPYLPSGTRIYVLINTYQGSLLSENCVLSSFTTEGQPPPDITDIAPKFFTPNNDGFNDYWSVSSTDKITVQSIFVYDRYGKLLKQMLPGQQWDGTYNGENLPSDSYWYALITVNTDKIKGFFTLKR